MKMRLLVMRENLSWIYFVSSKMEISNILLLLSLNPSLDLDMFLVISCSFLILTMSLSLSMDYLATPLFRPLTPITHDQSTKS